MGRRIVLGIMLLLVCRCVEAKDLKKLRFLPHWVPQAQFAGYYVAAEMGFYRDAGLDVDLLTGGPKIMPAEFLRDGKAEIGSTFLSAAIKARGSGIELVDIAQLIQRSALLLVVRADSGIMGPEDLDGKVITVWPEFDLQPKALFRKFNVNPVLIPQLYSFNLFLRGGADGASAMSYNEYHRLLNCGLNADEMRVFSYADYGLNFPEDGIYCLRSTLNADPDMCRAFVTASIRGWLYAFEYEDAALDIVMKYVHQANVPTTRVHQRWMLDAMKGLLMPSGDPARIGFLPEKEYLKVATEMKEKGMIQSIVPYNEFYENCAE